MAGILSGVFDSANVQGGDSYGQNQDYSAEVEDALAFEETITVGHSESVGYETADGTTHTWSNSQELSLTVGLDATLGAAADVSQGSMTEDF